MHFFIKLYDSVILNNENYFNSSSSFKATTDYEVNDAKYAFTSYPELFADCIEGNMCESALDFTGRKIVLAFSLTISKKENKWVLMDPAIIADPNAH